MPSAFALRYDSDTESPARTPRERRSSDSDAESGSSGEAQGYGAAGKGAFSPSKGMGAVAEALSDEQLPLLVAYQQLGALASSTRRVQRALEQNRGNFERQLARASRAALYIAWRRWKLGLAECARRAKLFRRAVAKFASGTKARAFSKWLQEVDEARGEEDDSEAKLRMVLNFMRRRKLARGWYRWVERMSEGERERESRLEGLDALERAEARRRQGLLTKALKRMAQRKKAAAFGAMVARTAQKKRLRALGRKCVLRIQKRRLAAAWLGFAGVVADRLAKKRRADGALRKMARLRLGKAFRGYLAAIERRRRQRYLVNRCVRKLQLRAQAAAFEGFVAQVERRRAKRASAKRAIRKMTHFRLGKAYAGYKAAVDRIVYYKGLLKKCALRMKHLKSSQAFVAWSRLVRWLRDDKNRAEMEASRGRLGLLEGEHARLYEDNRRMAGIIDSGEWGRARVQELQQAGAVLSGEREALVSLLGRLRREYVSTAERAARQDEEMRALKDNMLNVSAPQRNKLIVRGASNFNAMQRAIRQDAVDQARPDFLARAKQHFTLDSVSIFPDGEMHVQPVQPTTTQPFARMVPHGGRQPSQLKDGGAAAAGSAHRDARRAEAAASSERVLAALQALNPGEIGALKTALRGMDSM